MEDWQAAFAAKSERRRKRSLQRRVIRRAAAFALISAAILAGLWLADRSADFLFLR